ncbi:MAG: hypothetical protein V4722_23615 [Bacteroidota bacterium]
MRYILSALIIISTICSAQTNKIKESANDSMKELADSSDLDAYKSGAMFKNSLIITYLGYGLMVQGKELEIKKNEEPLNKIKSAQKKIAKSKFYVVINDSSIGPGQLADLIHTLEKTGITNYRVIDLYSFIDKHFNSPEPEIELIPTTKDSVIQNGFLDSNNIQNLVRMYSFRNLHFRSQKPSKFTQCLINVLPYFHAPKGMTDLPDKS